MLPLRLQVVAVVMMCILIDVLTGFLTSYAVVEKDKDCFGRDSVASFYVTATVLAVFTVELSLRIISQGKVVHFFFLGALALHLLARSMYAK